MDVCVCGARPCVDPGALCWPLGSRVGPVPAHRGFPEGVSPGRLPLHKRVVLGDPPALLCGPLQMPLGAAEREAPRGAHL